MSLQFILDLIFPKLCFGCGKPGNYVCSSCEKLITFTRIPLCPICEKPSPRGTTHQKCLTKLSINGMYVLGDYRGILRKLIHELKYKNVYTVSETLIDYILKYQDFFFTGFDFITAVPLYKNRLKERGYNQAEILATILKSRIHKPYKNLLERIHPTLPQMSIKDQKKRKINVKGAFSLIEKNIVVGKNILLVDDVATTGATIFEAAKVLKQNGAKSVWGLVIARNFRRF